MHSVTSFLALDLRMLTSFSCSHFVILVQLPENARSTAYNDLCALMRSASWQIYKKRACLFREKYAKHSEFLTSFALSWDSTVWLGMCAKCSKFVQSISCLVLFVSVKRKVMKQIKFVNFLLFALCL